MSAYFARKLPHIYFLSALHAAHGSNRLHPNPRTAASLARMQNKDRAVVCYYLSWTIFFILSFMSFFIKDRSCTSCLNSDSSTVQIADACRTKCINEKKKKQTKRKRKGRGDHNQKYVERSRYVQEMPGRALAVSSVPPFTSERNIENPSRSVSR